MFGGFSGGSDNKESTCNAGDAASIPGLGRSPGEGISYPIQCSWIAAWKEDTGRLQSMES